MNCLFAKIQLSPVRSLLQVQLLVFSSWVLLFQSVSAQKHKQEKSTKNNKNAVEKKSTKNNKNPIKNVNLSV